jgi:hypothetical protein
MKKSENAADLEFPATALARVANTGKIFAA